MKGFLKITVLAVLLLWTACSRQEVVWVAAWKETSPLSTARSGAAVVAFNDVIVVIGGVDGKKFLKTTALARIQENGSLGPWQDGPPLNEPRGFFDAAVHNGSIYVVGGGNGPYGKNLLRTVEKTRIKSDGTLGPWEKERFSMNMPRRCSKVVVVEDRLFALGGFGGDLLDTVEHARILEDGTVDEWYEEGERLTVSRYISGVKKVGDTTYVVSGHDQVEGVGITEVEWSRVIDEAGFTAWKKTAPLAVGRYGLDVTAHGGYIYALGGITGAEYLDSIEMSRIGPDGELEEWRMTTPLFEPRAMLGAVVYKDRIYVLGGTNQDGYLKSVVYATFNELGDIGFWSSRKEAERYRRALEKKAEGKKAPLPNRGVVIKTMPTKRYVYILVATDKGQVWLAAPKRELNAGESIAYSKGVSMPNFYSKELKLNFPAVLFVGEVQKLGK
ncbi:MAG: Kelch repeat-containing protein [Candidatus Binatia bacterium]